MAQALGINLAQALNPSQVTAFAQQMSDMGIQVGATGKTIPGLGPTSAAAFTAMESAGAAAAASGQWVQIGTAIDDGISVGVNESTGAVTTSVATVSRMP